MTERPMRDHPLERTVLGGHQTAMAAGPKSDAAPAPLRAGSRARRDLSATLVTLGRP